VRRTLRRTLITIANNSSLVRRAAAIVVANSIATGEVADSYGYLRQRFIDHGRSSKVDRTTRQDIVAQFERIDRELPMASTPTDGLFLAEMLLNVDARGAVIECGCYAGGSASKLSIVAKLAQRELFVYDSFEGLPPADRYYLRDHHCRRGATWTSDWTAGRYSTRQEQVQGNIERYGELSVCHFVKGWFSETLTDQTLPTEIGFAFADVDLADSARDCLIAIWPRLSDKGVYATHDAAYVKVLHELYRPELWRDVLKATPPILFGAGYGLCDSSPHLGYMVKGELLSPDYLKSLTMDR
jgi:O-methyltransferase